MVVSIAIYTLCWLFSYLIVRGRYRKSPKNKMPLITIVVVSLLFTLYNYYLTTNSTSMALDRQNYLAEFEGLRDSPSLGVILVQSLIIKLGGGFDALLYFSSFTCVFLTLFAYRLSKQAVPFTLLLLFVSLYISTSFINIKQCYTNALSSLILVLLIEHKGALVNMICIFLIFLACVFHSSGFILIPIYIYMMYYNKDLNVKKVVLLLVFFAIFFLPIMQFFASVVSGFVPLLSNKINEYFLEGSIHAENSSIITIFKGVNIYYITYIGIKWRNKLKELIPNYDKFLFVSIVCSFLYIMALYSYWMSRFMYLFIFVVFIFFSELILYIPQRKKAIIMVFLFTSVITYREWILIYLLYGGI